MSTILAGTLTMATLLAVVLTLVTSFLDTSAAQAAATEEAWKDRVETLRGEISILSTSGADLLGGTDVTVEVENIGEATVSDFERMDVIVRYTKLLGGLEVKRLTYVEGAPLDNQWTVSSISPDDFGPAVWDPGETATLDLRLVPLVLSGSNATVAVVIPGGASASAYFAN